MKIQIDSPEDLGAVVRATRKTLGLRQDDTAGAIGVSENFLSKVERGSDTVQWGKLFQVLQQLGISITVNAPIADATEPDMSLQTGTENKELR